MVNQYPHTLTVTTLSNSSKDSNGDWTGGTPTTSTYPCRYELNSTPGVAGGLIDGADGKMVDFQGVVYLKTTDIINVGSPVSIDVNGRTVTGSVVKFSNGQLNTRLWLR